MPSITLHPRAAPAVPAAPQDTICNPLPQLLQTPSGLAIAELQGTINIPSPDEEHEGGDEDHAKSADAAVVETPIGKLIFPDYSPQNPSDDSKWMKRVYLYVGRYQRMTGEVKKLPKPLAIIQRRQRRDAGHGDMGAAAGTDPEGREAEGSEDELEIVEIVKYKILFGSRPEPLVNE